VSKYEGGEEMPKYVIERDLPGAGNLTSEELKEAAMKSNEAIEEIGKDIQWVESFVTTDKFYCIYIAQNEDLIYEHGKKSGFPVHKISEIKGMTDPTRSE
jgi:predicted Rdx family selenoprotein